MAIEAAQTEIEYSWMRKKKIQVCRLYPDGFLLLNEDPELWILSNPADHMSVRRLELVLHDSSKRVETIGYSIGMLSHLTHLFITGGAFERLPTSISRLHNLQRLEFHYCSSLQELPANLGALESLTFLSLVQCSLMKSLPNSIVKLSNFKTLHLIDCQSLTELPAISNVTELILHNCCNIHCHPQGLCNLEHLHLPSCSQQILAHLTYDSRSLRHLTLYICTLCQHPLRELPENLVLLSQLLVLNIQETAIKWLPWSITRMSNLCLLILSESFRLETLPKHLNDSVTISVKDKHIRKTWEELKTEIQLFSVPIIKVGAAHFRSTPGYLQYAWNPGLWTQSNCLRSVVRVLELEFRDHNILASCIRELPELTHLYISYSCFCQLPLNLKFLRITHLSLIQCDIQSNCDNLPKQKSDNMLAELDLPVSLTHFALQSYGYGSLSDNSCPTSSIRKLSNLNTLELSRYVDLDLSLLELNLVKLKIRDCNIKSLPKGLQHLEVIHSRHWCHECCVELELCLNQVVNLKTLSVTCYNIKVLPTILRHQSLQELQLRDCFNLKKLPSNLNEWVELRILNVSGTRVTSLPYSIANLQNLRHLILPRCFKLDSLPKNFEGKVSISIDGTDDMYYEHAGYYNSSYDSNEDNEIVLGSIEGGDEAVLEEFRHHIIEQASSHSLLNPLSDATLVHEGSHFDGGADPIDNVFSSSQNLETDFFLTGNEEWIVPLAPNIISDYNEPDGHDFVSNIRQVHANPEELEVGEYSSHALCNLQIQEMEILPSRDRACAETLVDDLAAKSSSNSHKTNSFGKNNLADNGQNKNPQSDVKKDKTKKKEISKEHTTTLGPKHEADRCCRAFWCLKIYNEAQIEAL